VQAAAQVKTGMGRSNDMQVIALTLSDGTTTHEAEWFTSQTTPIPQPGTRGEWILEPSQYGLKAKKPRTGAPGGGGFRPRDPKESSAIQRQHSQEMALRLLAVQVTRGQLTEGTDIKATIKGYADWFDDDIAAGVERKHPSQKLVNGLPVHNEPEPTGTPEAVTPTPDYTQTGTVPAGGEDIPFSPSVI